MFAGFVIFSIVGFMSYITKKPIQELAASGQRGGALPHTIYREPIVKTAEMITGCVALLGVAHWLCCIVGGCSLAVLFYLG